MHKKRVNPLNIGGRYSPFGMLVPNRHGSSNEYRYGFGGHEKDDELKGEGNSYDFGGYGLDVRLGRRWQADPLAHKAPGWSPYRTFFNNPLYFNDPTGMFEEGGGDPPVKKDKTTRLAGWNKKSQQITSDFNNKVQEIASDPINKGLEAVNNTLSGTAQLVGDVLGLTNVMGFDNQTGSAIGSVIETISEIPNMTNEQQGAAMAVGVVMLAEVTITKKAKLPNVSAKMISQFGSKTLDAGVSLTLKQKEAHIFEGTLHPKPYLDQISNIMGGRRNLIRSALEQGNGSFPSAGKFELPFKAGGRDLIMRGFVNKGTPIINTMFDPSVPLN